MLNTQDKIDKHHILPREKGGNDDESNFVLLHRECHKYVTFTKSKKLQARFRKDQILLGLKLVL